jgi:hypothetical protein
MSARQSFSHGHSKVGQVEMRKKRTSGKRVIDGKTCNTDTATVVARGKYEDQNGYNSEGTLYQTRGGAFFLVHLWTVEGDVGGRPKVYFEAMRSGSTNTPDTRSRPDCLPRTAGHPISLVGGDEFVANIHL